MPWQCCNNMNNKLSSINSNKVSFGYCNIDKITKDNLMENIDQWIKNKSMHNYIISINLGKICMMQKDKKLFNCINNSTINISDGISVIIASKLIGNPIPERIPGIDLMDNLLKMAHLHKYRVFFFGAKKKVLIQLINIYQKKYPNLQISGYRDGYFNKSDIEDIITQINNSKTDILFLGLGLPQKEYFVYDYHKIINCPVIVPVGGSFDVLAGLKRRAPLFMQKIGAEWLWRSGYDFTRFLLILKNILTYIQIIYRDAISKQKYNKPVNIA